MTESSLAMSLSNHSLSFAGYIFPDFLMSMDFDHKLTGDMLQILKQRSKSITEKMIQDHTLINACFKVQIVNFIFSICHALQQTPDTRYLAIELFNRNYLLSIISILGTNDDSNMYVRKINDSNQINHTYNLDMFACILIASKFTESSEVLHNNTVLTELSAIGENYTLQDVMKAEKNILKQLNYEVFIPTVLTYTDLMLAKIDTDERIDKAQIHKNCIYVVDITYIHHNEIYQKFNFLITNDWEWSIERRFQFQTIENDKLLLSSAIIYTTVMLGAHIPLEELEKILEQLEDIADTHINDIKALSRIICEKCIL